MKNTILEMAMQSLDSALQMAESALHAVLAPYGDNGLELNTRPTDLYSVWGETEPNVFKKVLKVRSHQFEGLQMYVGEEEGWRYLDCTDYKFLLQEVQSAIRAIGDE
jgi:hypothetical protein